MDAGALIESASKAFAHGSPVGRVNASVSRLLVPGSSVPNVRGWKGVFPDV